MSIPNSTQYSNSSQTGPISQGSAEPVFNKPPSQPSFNLFSCTQDEKIKVKPENLQQINSALFHLKAEIQKEIEIQKLNSSETFLNTFDEAINEEKPCLSLPSELDLKKEHFNHFVQLFAHINLKHSFYSNPKEKFIPGGMNNSSFLKYEVHILRYFGYILSKNKDNSGFSFIPPQKIDFVSFKQIEEAFQNYLEMQKAFKNLPENLNEFITYEKKHTYLTSPARTIIDSETIGCRFPLFTNTSYYSISLFEPFAVIGIWIPEEKGKLFVSQTELNFHHLKRTVHSKNEILFLIHPESELFFQDLIIEYPQLPVMVPALALSSLRTLLVAIPKSPNTWEHVMVKVTLNEKSSDVLRVLSFKECASSIGISTILSTQLEQEIDSAIKIECLGDSFAFVPDRVKTFCVQPPEKYGMIVRPIPNFFLNENYSTYTLIPLASVLNINSGILLNMVKNSKLNPTEFITSHLLKPFAELLTHFFLSKSISIEAHSQNLLWIIDRKNLMPIKLVIRDMGGVTIGQQNPYFKDREFNPKYKILPDSKDTDYYSPNYLEDTSIAIEYYFVNSLLFGLTKAFIKLNFQESDPEFKKWLEELPKNYWQNWHIDSKEDENIHQNNLKELDFKRYGYVEVLFGKIFLATMKNSPIYTIVNQDPSHEGLFEFWEKSFNTHNTGHWFITFIKVFYGAYLEAKKLKTIELR